MPEPPDGPRWLHEIKHDGFRTLVVLDRGRARAFTRQGYDWTGRYQPLLASFASLPCRSAVIDGEIVVEDDQGVSDFDALPWAIRHDPRRLVFFTFDLLNLDSEDLRRRELVARRDKLQSLIEEGSRALRYSESFEGDGRAFFAAAVHHGLEGIVSKRRSSPYRSGPSKAWLKTKNAIESELVLLGLERDEGGRPFAHVGREGSRGLSYTGMAFVALGALDRERLAREIEHLAVASCAVEGVRRPRAQQVRWLRPELRVRVRHLRTASSLRHASVRALI